MTLVVSVLRMGDRRGERKETDGKHAMSAKTEMEECRRGRPKDMADS